MIVVLTDSQADIQPDFLQDWDLSRSSSCDRNIHKSNFFENLYIGFWEHKSKFYESCFHGQTDNSVFYKIET